MVVVRRYRPRKVSRRGNSRLGGREDHWWIEVLSGSNTGSRTVAGVHSHGTLVIMDDLLKTLLSVTAAETDTACTLLLSISCSAILEPHLDPVLSDS